MNPNMILILKPSKQWNRINRRHYYGRQRFLKCHNVHPYDILKWLRVCRQKLLKQWANRGTALGQGMPQNLGLASWNISVYRCKKEHSVAFKIRQNAFSASPDPAEGAHNAPCITPYLHTVGSIRGYAHAVGFAAARRCLRFLVLIYNNTF